MGMEQLRIKIEEQQAVYRDLKAGNDGTVRYKEFHNGEWGTDDENYTNRLRLAYYLLYCHIEDEEAVVFLFGEELKDRERNSFQGTGSTLKILTHLIRKYNGDGKYAGLLERAKNANFDCACGYDPDGQMEDDFGANSLLDCICLCWEMEYRDVMGSLVDEWKENITEWSDPNRRALIDFNTFLGRDAENERIYQQQLAEILSAEKSSARDIISGYKDLIRHYIHMCDYGKALCLCEKVIKTTDYGQIRTLRLFKDILEACFEVTANHTEAAAGLWNWAKTELQKVPQSSWYGNLYTKGIAAAKAMKDPYGKQLEQETGVQIQNQRDYMEMIRQLYAVEELQGYSEEEIAVVKKYFDPLPPVLEEFWKKAARTEAIHRAEDLWIGPEDFKKWAWLREEDYLVILIENQGCCRVGIRREDLARKDPPVYTVKIDDQKWTLCAETFSEFLKAALAYEAVFQFPFHGEELMYWLTEEELETVQSSLEKQPFGLRGWMEMEMSFYSNADDNMAVVMDCGDLEVLYGAASEAGYKKLMEVMEGLGEAI